MSPAAIGPWSGAVDVGAVACDPELNVVWANEWMRSRFGVSMSVSRPAAMREILGVAATEERRRLLEPLSRDATGPVRYQDLFEGARRLVTAWRLDPSALGVPGYVLVCEARSTRGAQDDQWPLPRTFTRTHLGVLASLTNREMGLLWSVGQGMSDKEIAARTSRTKNTIETHVSSILRKLGTPTRVVLARFLGERGLTAFTEAEWDVIAAGAVR